MACGKRALVLDPLARYHQPCRRSTAPCFSAWAQAGKELLVWVARVNVPEGSIRLPE